MMKSRSILKQVISPFLSLSLLLILLAGCGDDSAIGGSGGNCIGIRCQNVGGGGGKDPQTAPTLSVAPENGKNVLTLVPPSGTPATIFNVYWSSSLQGTVTQIPAVVSPFTHDGLANGAPIFYVATALTGAGESAPSAVAGGMPGKWTELTPSGTLPPARDSHTAVYNASTDRMVVFGGRGASQAFNDYWVLQNSTKTTLAWNQFVTSAPPDRLGHSAVYNSQTNRMTLFGGSFNVTGSSFTNELWGVTSADASTSLPQWTPLVGGTGPTPRWGHAAGYDQPNDKMIVFGGSTQTGQGLSNEVWVLNQATAPTPSWKSVVTAGGPSARCCMAAAYDPANRRMILFGGFGGFGPAGAILFGDLWTLTFNQAFSTATWQNLTPSGGTPPPLRCCAASLWDGTKFLLFGGGEIGTPSDDKIHALILETATFAPAVGPAGPASRIFPTAVPAGKFLLFGGSGASGPLNDLWRLD